MIKHCSLVAAAILVFALPVEADTLYVAGPPPAAPGHPMHLGADHRAMQVGDLVHISFNFNGNVNNADTATTTNQYSLSNNPGIGGLALPILKLGAGIGANRADSLGKTQTIVQTFTSSMTATVTSVTPAGTMTVAGDQKLTVNGVPQTLHVTGTIRQEDIDNTDTIVSSDVANIDAHFTGIDSQEKNRGILQKIVGFLFG